MCVKGSGDENLLYRLLKIKTIRITNIKRCFSFSSCFWKVDSGLGCRKPRENTTPNLAMRKNCVIYRIRIFLGPTRDRDHEKWREVNSKHQPLQGGRGHRDGSPLAEHGEKGAAIETGKEKMPTFNKFLKAEYGIGWWFRITGSPRHSGGHAHSWAPTQCHQNSGDRSGGGQRKLPVPWCTNLQSHALPPTLLSWKTEAWSREGRGLEWPNLKAQGRPTASGEQAVLRLKT